MTNRRFTQIGIDRLVRLGWLEKTSALVLAGNSASEIEEVLQHDLRGSFQYKEQVVRGSIDKTITILMRVWVRPPKELASFCEKGKALLENLSHSQRKPIHWGMLMAVYPFWSNVATQVGRLMRLQETVAALQVQRRMREQYGERETVSRRTRYVLRSFIDWGVLEETSKKGIYRSTAAMTIDDIRMLVWLIEAQLHTDPKGRNCFSSLSDSPSLFPFRFVPTSCKRVLSSSEQLEQLSDGSTDPIIGFK